MTSAELFHRCLEDVLPGSTAELSRFLNLAIEQLPVAARKLRDVDYKAGFETIAAATEGFELTLACCGILEKSFPQERVTLSELKAELFDSLKSINMGMEEQKRFDVADLLQFELAPTLLKLKTFIFEDS